jgi:hypothetical protein
MVKHQVSKLSKLRMTVVSKLNQLIHNAKIKLHSLKCQALQLILCSAHHNISINNLITKKILRVTRRRLSQTECSNNWGLKHSKVDRLPQFS